jgi:hypothetical protein
MPQIEVEDTLELFRRCQRDEFAAVFESAALDQAMDDFRLEFRNDAVEMGRAQDAIEQALWFR